MSIRDQLKAKHERYENDKEREFNELKTRYEHEARKFIEKVIIPRFSKLASIYPEETYLYIPFYINGKECFHTKVENGRRICVKRDVVLVATTLASEYDIQGRKKYLEGELFGYEFSLSLK